MPREVVAACNDPRGFVPVWRHYLKKHLIELGVDKQWLRDNLAFVMDYHASLGLTDADHVRHGRLMYPAAPMMRGMERNMRITLRELVAFNPNSSPRLRAAVFLIQVPSAWEMKAAEVVALMQDEDKAMPERSRQFAGVTAKTIEHTRKFIREALKR